MTETEIKRRMKKLSVINLMLILCFNINYNRVSKRENCCVIALFLPQRCKHHPGGGNYHLAANMLSERSFSFRLDHFESKRATLIKY